MKLTLLAFFVLTCQLANAQFNKGDKVLSGTISFNTQRAPNSENGGLTNKVNSFSADPYFGFFTSTNFLMGVGLGYDAYFQEYYNYEPYTNEVKSRSISPGIFAERYFNITDKFLFSIVGTAKFSRGHEEYKQVIESSGETIESKEQSYRLSVSLNPTFTFMPSEKWGLRAGIGHVVYSFFRNLSTDEKANNFSLNYGAVSFGLAYYFQ